MARVSKDDLEARFYDVFSGWDKADREAALKVLATLHRHLPADTKAKQTKTDKTSDQVAGSGNMVNAQPAATLLDQQAEGEAIR